MAETRAPFARRPARRRLDVIAVLVVSLVATLVGRLYYVQMLDDNKPQQTAGDLHQGDIVVAAPRGLVVDALGRPLITNKTIRVVTVDRQALQKQPDQGHQVLTAVATLIGTTEPALAQKITPCGKNVPSPCWTGEPYQPVPVLTDAPTAVVLALSEHRELYPGVAVQTQTVRSYPGGTLAANVLGYAGAVTADDEAANPKLTDADSIGLTGLEEQYDSVLRGVDGAQVVHLDARGIAVGSAGDVAAQQGDTLVTSIDANVQALVQNALASQIAASRLQGKPATSGSVVVMDPNTGRILAMASYPTYDPQLFVGGISDADYAALTAPTANDPLLDRATAGAYAPGSTFKLITSSSLVTNNQITLNGKYPCPAYLTVDGRVKTNYDSETFGYPLTLKQALQVSCDTFFYAPEAAEYYADQAKISAGGKATENLQKMASEFGIGTKPGVDLPDAEQSTGSYADRETRLARWNANKAQYCADAQKGFPTEPDPTQRAYLTQLAKENCTDGWRYRAGDNADMAIGQGETTVSPLQLAVAYSAMLNGGTVWKPTLGWGVVDAAGKVVQTITPTAKNKLPVSQATLNYFASSLQFTADHTVSGALAFDGTPYKTSLGGKTGTAEVQGHLDTSWLASWGPVSTDANGNPHAKFVVVGMVEQAGTGASAAAPMIRAVYNGLLGNGQAAVLPDSTPESALPAIAPQTGTSSLPVTPIPTVGQTPTPDAVPTPTTTKTGPSR